MMGRRMIVVDGVMIVVDEVTAVTPNRHDPASWSTVLLRSGKAVDVHRAAPPLIAEIAGLPGGTNYTPGDFNSSDRSARGDGGWSTHMTTGDEEYQLLDPADWPNPRT